MIGIIDYGAGNIKSVQNALEFVGAKSELVSYADRLKSYDKLLLPGVGAFGKAMEQLKSNNLDSAILEFISKGRPFLGIYLGMQLLFDKSYEYGEHKGLGLIGGEVVPLGPYLADPALKVPHMGWNALHLCRPQEPLFRYISEGECVYYVHSFYARNCRESTLATSEYGIAVTGAVKNGLVYGTQFHPEKSGETGLRLLKAFAEM